MPIQFKSPEEVLQRAERTAQILYEGHLRDGTDLNPFSTESARDTWARGYHGLGPRSYENGVAWNYRYQLGAATRRLVFANETSAKRWDNQCSY